MNGKIKLLIVIILMGAWVTLSGCAQCPACNCPDPIKETVIIDFPGHQELHVNCKGWNDETGERIQQNGTIFVEVHAGHEYVHENNRLVILPGLRIDLDLDNQKTYDLEDCHVYKLARYNVTISGKTYSTNMDVSVLDCKNYYNCRVTERIIDDFKD